MIPASGRTLPFIIWECRRPRVRIPAEPLYLLPFVVLVADDAFFSFFSFRRFNGLFWVLSRQTDDQGGNKYGILVGRLVISK